MAVVSGTILTLKLLAKVAIKKVSVNAIKAKAKDFVVKKAKDKIKSKFKKKKVKGKDVARKMMGGGEERGGALSIASPSGSIVSSPAGGLIPSSSDTEGSLVVSKSGIAKELGLEPFMNSLTSVKDSVDSIKKSLNDNNKDAQDRIDDQRLLNNKLNKEDREAELENKKKGSGIGKKLLGKGKDVADNFLSRIIKFFAMTLLGMLVNGLIGGARDVILAFRVGFELLKNSGKTLRQGIGKFKTVLSKGLKSIGKPFSKIGSSIKNVFVNLGNKVIGWVGDLIGKAKQWADDAIKWLSKAFPKTANFVKNVGSKALNVVKNVGSKAKNFIKTVGSKASNIAKTVGSKASSASKFVSNVGSKASKIAKTVKASKIAKIAKTVGSKVSSAAKFVSNVGSKATKLAKTVGSKVSAAKNFVKTQAKNVVKNVGSKVAKAGKGVAKTVGKQGSKWIAKLFGKNAAKAMAGPAAKGIFKTLAKAAKGIRIPVIGPLLVAVTSILSGDPIGKTLFKTMGTAIGGSIGLSLPLPVPGNPLAMMAGELIGEYLGNMFHILFKGGGIKAVGQQLKKDLLSLFNVGKHIVKWIGGGITRFIKNVIKTDPIEVKSGWGVRSALTKATKIFGMYDWFKGLGFAGGKNGQIDKFPNVLNLLFPWKYIPLLAKSFFPSKEDRVAENIARGKSLDDKKEKEEKQTASLGSQEGNTDIDSISESASYEDGGEEASTIVMGGGGGDQAPPPPSQEGKSSFITLGSDDSTKVLNTLSNAVLYKV